MTTVADYFVRANTAIKANGYSGDEIPVIDKVQHPEFWQQWLDYFAYIGMNSTVLMMADGAGRWTVPAEDPRDFDPMTATLAIEAGDRRRASVAAMKARLTPERRRALITRAKSMFVKTGKATPAECQETYDERMARLKREFADVAKQRATEHAAQAQEA
jgi:hypothetical protein